MEDRTQSGEECRQRDEHRRIELEKEYNSCLFRYFEAFERHNRITAEAGDQTTAVFVPLEEFLAFLREHGGLYV